jgi:hypothetical protein
MLGYENPFRDAARLFRSSTNVPSFGSTAPQLYIYICVRHVNGLVCVSAKCSLRVFHSAKRTDYAQHLTRTGHTCAICSALYDLGRRKAITCTENVVALCYVEGVWALELGKPGEVGLHMACNMEGTIAAQ